MSSSENDLATSGEEMPEVPAPKKRRAPRACDSCKRKKARCDGAQWPGSQCSNCINSRTECTYLVINKKRGPLKAYVETLETRLEKMEQLLQQHLPDSQSSQGESSRERRGSRPADDTFTFQSSNIGPPRNWTPSNGSPSVDEMQYSVVDPELNSSDDEYQYSALLSERLTNMSLDQQFPNRFIGKSSGVNLYRTALDLKSEYAGEASDAGHRANRRPEFWSVFSFERHALECHPYPSDFPARDLLRPLVHLYFKHVNVFTSLLHWPTFFKAIDDNLHVRDDGFRQVVLLVCANGSRFSDDPRVLVNDSWHSAGWKWFSQVDMLRKSWLAPNPPSLYDLQMHCLAVTFVQNSSVPQACWNMIRNGIGLAMDVGAHRRKVYRTKPTIEDELWKRAFWGLVAQDRAVSSGLGRPCAIQEEDLDLDMPTNCDDEYWTHPDPAQAFKQPATRPSTLAYFNLLLKLVQIHALALRTIYSSRKSKAALGFVGPEWEQKTVAQLESALQRWTGTVPDYLRWNPTNENRIFFVQSAALYCSYYQLQILIHRPFIISSNNTSPASFSSFALCMNAARSCIHIVDIAHRRAGFLPVTFFQHPAFTAAVVLLLNIFRSKRVGLSIDTVNEMKDVHAAMRVLKADENRWLALGRARDLLTELASVGDKVVESKTASLKRRRDSDDLVRVHSSTGFGQLDERDASDMLAGGRQQGPEDGAIVDDFLRQAIPHLASERTTPPLSSPTAFQPSTGTQLGTDLVICPSVTPIDLPEASGSLVDSNAWTWGANSQDGVARTTQGLDSFGSFNFFDLDAPQINDAALSQGQEAPPPLSATIEDTPDTLMSQDNLFYVPVEGHNAASSSVQTRRPSSVTESGPAILSPSTVSPGRVDTEEGRMMDMWTNVPSGFEGADWDAYITNMISMSGVPSQSSPDGPHEAA